MILNSEAGPKGEGQEARSKIVQEIWTGNVVENVGKRETCARQAGIEKIAMPLGYKFPNKFEHRNKPRRSGVHSNTEKSRTNDLWWPYRSPRDVKL